MRFSLTADHRDFYLKHGYIEFERLLSLEPLENLRKAIEASPQARFDLWRESDVVKKILFSRALSEIASQLFQAPLLKIGFDQYYDTGSGGFSPFASTQSVQEMSCAKPLAGALILSLTPSAFPLPGQPGHGVYLSPHKAIDWKAIFEQKEIQFMMIAYATKNTLYHFEPKDPHTHAWKSLGYVFGDRLKDTTHPVIYRLN